MAECFIIGSIPCWCIDKLANMLLSFMLNKTKQYHCYLYFPLTGEKTRTHARTDARLVVVENWVCYERCQPNNYLETETWGLMVGITENRCTHACTYACTHARTNEHNCNLFLLYHFRFHFCREWYAYWFDMSNSISTQWDIVCINISSH